MHQTIAVLTSFVRAVHLKRVLHEVDPTPRLNFWRVIYGNLMDMAVIDWTKLFGSHTNQPTHWKSVVPEAEHDAFRKGLLKAVGLSCEEWKKYWEEIKTYRDERAAHEAPIAEDADGNFPRFDVALRAAYFYYDWTLRRTRERGEAHHYPLDLEEYCQRFSKQAREAAQRAIAATATMKETVR